MKLTIDQQKLIPIAMAAVLVLILLIVISICTPLLGKLQNNHKQRLAYSQETAALKKILSMSKDHKSKVVLSDASKIDEVLEEVVKIGAKHDVIFDFKDLPTEDTNVTSDLYKRLTVDIQTSGTYKSVGEFLSEIRNIPEVIIDINQLSITPEMGDSSKLLVHINLEFYFAKTNET